jgi:hypothetical protein
MAEHVAIRQFPFERDGHTVVVLQGARFPSTDPIVKQHPTMFEPHKRAVRKRRTNR